MSILSKPFDFVNAINFTKQDLMTGTENDELAEKIYDPYLTNRSLSYFVDTIELANIMNMASHLDKRLQFDYLLNTVRKRKRYSKWLKKQNIADLEAIAKFFGYSMPKSQTALKILTKQQLEKIKLTLVTGKQ